MKIIFALLFICLTSILGCSDNHPNGTYRCTKQTTNGKKASRKRKESNNNITDLALSMLGKSSCLYDQLEFKGNNTVVITALGQTYSTSYVVDDDYVRIKTDKTDLLLKIKDDQTLIGEGFIAGLFVKE